jgi:hypothetical protein
MCNLGHSLLLVERDQYLVEVEVEYTYSYLTLRCFKSIREVVAYLVTMINTVISAVTHNSHPTHNGLGSTSTLS